MSDDEPPEWAKTIEEQTQKNSERIDELAEKFDDGGDDEKDAEPPEWAKGMVEQVSENSERIEEIAKANGLSQQPGSGDGGGQEKDDSWEKLFGLPQGGETA